MNRPRMMSWLLAAWVVACALLNCTGWALSALHQLNPTGYTVALLAGAAGVFIWFKKSGTNFPVLPHLQVLRRRFRRGFPLAFLVLSGLVLLSGVLYAPNNYDALAYRVPRVLHWLAEGQWHWIHTEFHRLNTRGCGIEWVSAPFLALLRTDRFLFLINIVSFALLPGLIFSVFTRIGVRARVAWPWMWLLPTGYCYLLQAGGIGNDLFGAVFPLAALHFALRAKERQSMTDISLAVLATALITSAKASNIPLVLPAALALLPCWRICLKYFPVTISVGLVAVFASFAPMAIRNVKYCGDWTGAKAEHIEGMRGDHLLRAANNVVLLTVQNFAPPIFPLAKKWNDAVLKYMPQKLHERLAREFEGGGADWQTSELQWDFNAGLGTGLSVLLAASVIAGWSSRRKTNARRQKLNPLQFSVTTAICVAGLVYLANMGLSGIGRVAAPFYLPIAGVLLIPCWQLCVVRQTWWRGLAWCGLLLALLMLVITPPRPLWPAETVLGKLATSHKASSFVTLASGIYTVNRVRPDALAKLRNELPANETVIGMITSDDPETSLWRPFGSRKVLHVIPGDTGGQIRSWGVRYVFVREDRYQQYFQQPFEQWLIEVNGQVIKKIPLMLNAASGYRNWFVVFLPPATN